MSAKTTSIPPESPLAAGARASVLQGGRTDTDGKTLRFTLTQPVKLHVSQLGNRAAIDIADTNFTGVMPDLVPPPKPVAKPVDVASLPEIKLRTGAYEKFTRLVFDWPKDVTYQVYPGAGKMTMRFNAPIRVDVSALSKFAPPWVKNASWKIEGNSTVVEFETDSDSGYHDFKDGTHVVLDILAPKTDGAVYAPPGTAKPAITKMDAVKAPPKTGASNAQASGHHGGHKLAAAPPSRRKKAGRTQPRSSFQPRRNQAR